MKIKPSYRHLTIFFDFFKNNMDKIKTNPEEVEDLFAEYVRDSIQDPKLSDYEKGYIAGSSFMGVLRSFQKTVETMKETL